MIGLQKAGHASEICASMDLTGFDCIAAAGGDGTLHECISGLMSRTNSTAVLPVLAPIAAGTGNSFVLELHGTTAWQASVQRIIRGIHAPIDLLKLTCQHRCVFTDHFCC